MDEDVLETSFTPTEASRAAAVRCNFELTYARASQPRGLGPARMDGGGAFDDAWNRGETIDSSWDNGDEVPDSNATEQEWVDHFASMAINEAVHEVLEWFQVDGKSYLDPHGRHDVKIYDLVSELAAKLVELRSSSEGKSNGNPAWH